MTMVSAIRPITLLALAAIALSAGGSMADTLSDRRWKERILVVFAADGAAADGVASGFLADTTELDERDMTILAVVGDVVSAPHGAAPRDETAARLRQRFAVDGEAREPVTVLIGKDGGEKWRTAGPISPDEVYAIIDAMPMRRAGD